MRADVACRPRPYGAHYWAALIIWGVITGCATAPINQPQQSVSTQCQGEPKCVAMICRDPNDLATCYCPATLPDGRRQPLSPEECESTLGDPNYDHQVDLAGGIGGGGKGERGKTGKPDGTNNPFKKLTPHPDKPNKVIYKDPHTGDKVEIAKPAGFDEWWNSKK
jgi:hypothetical protein